MSTFYFSRIDNCNSMLFGYTNGVTSDLQWIQNYAARTIMRITKFVNISTNSLCAIALCFQCHSSTTPSYITDMLQKSHHTHATLASAHTPCLFSIDMHTLRQHLVIGHFLLLLLSVTLFKMMSCAPHHCHHQCFLCRHTCFAQLTKTEHSI